MCKKTLAIGAKRLTERFFDWKITVFHCLSKVFVKKNNMAYLNYQFTSMPYYLTISFQVRFLLYCAMNYKKRGIIKSPTNGEKI